MKIAKSQKIKFLYQDLNLRERLALGKATLFPKKTNIPTVYTTKKLRYFLPSLEPKIEKVSAN